MASVTECPSPFILRAIATGGIQEPLLGVYLEHLEHCDACCAEIDREAASWTGAVAGGGRAEGADSWRDRGAADGNDWVGDWLDTLKRTTPIAPVNADSPIDRKMGPFRIVSVLGEGASAVVYEAIDEELDRRVVLKVLRSIHGGDVGRRQMVVVEARALAAVQHEAIMPLLQLFWFDESPVLVFPRLPGETLADALASGRMTCCAGLEVVRDVARGLGHSHTLGVFHYDVKPSNIWLHRLADGRDKPLLFDFGLSGGADESVGTPGYSDPATVASIQPEARDLFSLGVVLHECLAQCVDVPAGCRELVRRLTVAPARERPRATAVATEIDRILGASVRSRWMAAAATGLVVIGLAAAVMVPRVLRAPAAVQRPVDDGPLAPDVVFPARGFPVALSSDAGLQASVAKGPVLEIWDIVRNETQAEVPLAFVPDWVAFNTDASRVAAAGGTGDVAIIDVATGTIEATHRFDGRLSWIGWSGWNRDAFVVLSGHEVHAFFQGKGEKSTGNQSASWTRSMLRDGIVRISSLPGAEALVSLDTKGAITIWSVGNLSPDLQVQLPVVHNPQEADDKIGWKGPGVCYLTRGAHVFEHASHHGVVGYEVPGPVAGMVWPTDAEYVLLTRLSDGSSGVLLGDMQRRDWSRDFDLGSERIERIELLKDRRRVAAYAESGAIRVYRVRP